MNEKTQNRDERHDLLIEIGVEELPPKSLQALIRAFNDNVREGLKQAKLRFGDVEEFVTPRRLALRIKELSSSQDAQIVSKKGPMVSLAFDSTGKPTQAALGFAASCQTTVEALQIQKTDKGECLVFEKTLAGQSVDTLIPKILQEALHTLPLPKRMRWGEQKESFVRPVHWVVLLFGDQVISVEIFGIPSGQTTQGHRFHHPADIFLKTPSEYEDRLKGGKVVPDFEVRRQLIETALRKRAEQEKGTPSINTELLEQVTGLVEWPVVLLGRFDHAFLALPQEVLISSMQVHQKCFPLLDNYGKLLPMFLIVSNIETIDPDTVIHGNECVMQARLQDAVFFYQIDKEIPLEKRREDLKKVVFQHGLGSLWDKSNRIKALSECILDSVTSKHSTSSSFLNKSRADHNENNRKLLGRAALLCKTDLLTQMVGEFPELQGIMGRCYALQDGEPESVAKAIEEHYHPRFAQDTLPEMDTLPETSFGSFLALSDRIDTLVGLFGLGKHPTGDKDPFALRRQALAVLRILIEQGWDLDLNQLFSKAKELYGSLLSRDPIKPLLDFCFERLRGWYQNENVPVRVFEAVLAKEPTRPLDFNRRIEAVKYFQNLPEAESLSAANKRVRNILAKSEVPETSFDEDLLTEEAEIKLANAISEKEKKIKKSLEENDYTQALKSLASLKEPIDQFFDSVMVMVEDVPLRNNRLKLLNQLRALFLEIADISLL